MSAPEAKRQKTEQYELLYHGGIPGRGEFVRLAFEAAGQSYSDPGNEGDERKATVYQACDPKSTNDQDGNPPVFSPPALRVHGAGKGGKSLLIHQTPNILLYIGPKLGLVGSEEEDLYYVNQITLTALDINNEAHDTHHPLAVMKYYEDQKDAALEKSKDFRENRIPKFFSYFERILKGNEETGKGQYLVGNKLTYADTTVWQILDGLKFAFPKEMAAREKDYPLLFTKFYPGLKDQKWLKDYLASDRRLEYSMGVFRHYPELDRQ